MEPIQFEQSNKILGAPPSMTEEECAPLPVWTDGQRCISCWQLTWRERLSTFFFGKVWLHVYYGQTQPPVALDAKRTVFEIAKKRKIKIVYSCSNYAHHEHKTKLGAWLCGRFQLIRGV